jgi:chromosome segregation ATPase
MKEGSFEGLMSDLDFNPVHELEVKKIKTPDQLPDPLNLNHLPEDISRSGVVESLINQNDDLMARLNVSLRRVALLEEKITDARNESAQYKAKYENVKDQMLVMREQSRLLSDRTRQMEERTRQAEERAKKEDNGLIELKEQIQILEIRYAELYSTAEERRARLENELSLSQQVIRRYKKYRMNLRRATQIVREELRQLRGKKSHFEATIQDLRHNLSETTQYISSQAKDHKAQTQQLTQAFEAEIRGLKAEIEKLNENNLVLAARSTEMDRLFSDKVRLENELIIAERREEDFRLQSAAEISDLQKALARHRNDAKELALQLEAQTSTTQNLTESNAQLTDERKALTEQVETLQLLWRDQQNQIEKLTEQKTALQKLNQELSISINEYRREMRDIKEKLEAETMKFLAAEKNNQYQENIKKIITATGTQESQIKKVDPISPELLEKIDKVLTNLHVGR